MEEEKDFPDKPIEITSDNFEGATKKYPLIIIYCWARWCPPCKIIAPNIERLAEEHKGKIVFGKLNVDKSKEFPIKYGVMSIPTLLVFKNRELIDRIIGAMPYNILNSRVKTYLE